MDQDELLDTAVELGYRLLENGAEIYRVEESIQRILTAYGVESPEVFAIPSCIIATIGREQHSHTRIKRITVRGTNLDKVTRFNDLCRRVCRDTPALSQVRGEIARIVSSKEYSFPIRVLAVAVISAAFALLFGGDGRDAFAAAVCGIAAKLCVEQLERFHTNTFFTNIIGGTVIAAVALLEARLHLCDSFDMVVIGTLMNLVPGVAITNSMRDLIAGDLLAGIIKLMEAVFIAAAIALGTGIVLTVSRLF